MIEMQFMNVAGSTLKSKMVKTINNRNNDISFKLLKAKIAPAEVHFSETGFGKYADGSAIFEVNNFSTTLDGAIHGLTTPNSIVIEQLGNQIEKYRAEGIMVNIMQEDENFVHLYPAVDEHGTACLVMRIGMTKSFFNMVRMSLVERLNHENGVTNMSKSLLLRVEIDELEKVEATYWGYASEVCVTL
jgi:hypothetical protein